jgi:hypothetical protein
MLAITTNDTITIAGQPKSVQLALAQNAMAVHQPLYHGLAARQHILLTCSASAAVVSAAASTAAAPPPTRSLL